MMKTTFFAWVISIFAVVRIIVVTISLDMCIKMTCESYLGLVPQEYFDPVIYMIYVIRVFNDLF